jgi:hypothetical protein
MIKILKVLNKKIPTHDYRISLASCAELDITFAMPSDEESHPSIKLVDIDFFGGFNLWRDIKAMFKLIVHIRNNKYDIIHWYSSKYYLTGPLLSWFFCGSRSVITINGLGRVFVDRKLFFLKPIFILLLRISIKIAKAYSVQNTDDLILVKNIVGSNKSGYLIRSGFDDSGLAVRKNIKSYTESSKIKIINVSRILILFIIIKMFFIRQNLPTSSVLKNTFPN